jgi:hypothetical protein
MIVLRVIPFRYVFAIAFALLLFRSVPFAICYGTIGATVISPWSFAILFIFDW